MSIKYKVVARGRPDRRDGPMKFYPYIFSSGTVTLRELATDASQMSTLSTADMMAAIEACLTLIPQYLAQGKKVDLGDFGSIWLHFSAEGAEQEKQVSGKLIKTLLPRLMPGRLFLQVLHRATFQKIADRRTSLSK